MYLKFLYKDIKKRKLLFLIIVVILLCVSVLTQQFYKVITEQLQRKVQYYSNVYKIGFTFTTEEQKKLQQLFENTAFFAYYSAPQTKSSEVCELNVVGNYPRKEANSYSSDIKYANENIKYDKDLLAKFLEMTYTKNVLKSKSGLNEILESKNCSEIIIKKIDDVSQIKLSEYNVYELLSNITLVNNTKDSLNKINDFNIKLQQSDFKFMQVQIKELNPNDNVKETLTLIVLYFVLITAMTILVLRTIFMYLLYKMYDEYRIQLFYGATFKQIALRTGFYFIAIFITVVVILKLMLLHSEDNCLLFELSSYTLLFALFFYSLFLLNLYQKIFKKVRKTNVRIS